MVVYAALKLGRLPIYGIDPDPSSLSMDWLNFMAIIPASFCFFTIPTTIFLTLDLVINNQKLFFFDKIALFNSVVCILTFLHAKFYLAETFLWVMD